VFTRSLLNLVGIAVLIAFVAGLRSVIRDADPAPEWPASLVGAGPALAAVDLAKVFLEVGVVLGTRSGTWGAETRMLPMSCGSVPTDRSVP
jgi:hypothetical protein